MFALKDVTELPAHRGLVCGLRFAKSRRCAAVARWTPAAAGVRGRTAHYDSLRAAAARRLLACTLAAAREEGRHLRFLPSCESPHFPSGRAARVKALSRFAVAAHFLLQYEGEWRHPVGARSARLSRPPCSDRREGRCHPRVVGARYGERASARSFVATLLRMTIILSF